MTQWITDNNGNRASVERWGSEEEARASLDSLRNCINCTNCKGCKGCKGCTDCINCTDCKGYRGYTYCKGYTCTTGCAYLADCDLAKPHVRLPVSDPRGYTWIAVHNGDEWRIHAGCRVNWSIDEARAHWLAADYNGPETAKQTVGFALDWLASLDPEKLPR